MNDFKRRIYHSLGEMVTDTRAIMSHRDVLRSTMRGQLDAAFRERLMLVVTGVNGCRYCSYAHARQALAEGISTEEIEMLGENAFHGSPTEEVPALLYAQHWAETDGRPDSEVRAAVVERYGEETLERIEIVLRMIRMGNLMGNTFDYLLYRLSFGRLGGEARPSPDAEPSG
jgi:AhpD family alkylhydroperoxidase